MKRMIIKVAAIAITLITCTSCSASAKDRKTIYAEFNSTSPEYKNFAETVSSSLNCNPWDIELHKHMEYSIIQDDRGSVVAKKNVPVYEVYNCQTGKTVEVYSPSEHTDTFTLIPSEITTKPAVNNDFCGFAGKEIAQIYSR